MFFPQLWRRLMGPEQRAQPSDGTEQKTVTYDFSGNEPEALRLLKEYSRSPVEDLPYDTTAVLHVADALSKGRHLSSKEVTAARTLLGVSRLSIEHRLEVAELKVLAASRPKDLTEQEQTNLRLLCDRHPDEAPPLPGTLAAFRARAAELLDPLEDDNPFFKKMARDVLGAMLYAAASAGRKESEVARWVAEREFIEPLNLLSEEAASARLTLDGHAATQGTSTWVVVSSMLEDAFQKR